MTGKRREKGTEDRKKEGKAIKSRATSDGDVRTDEKERKPHKTTQERDLNKRSGEKMGEEERRKKRRRDAARRIREGAGGYHGWLPALQPNDTDKGCARWRQASWTTGTPRCGKRHVHETHRREMEERKRQ